MGSHGGGVMDEKCCENKYIIVFFMWIEMHR